MIQVCPIGPADVGRWGGYGSVRAVGAGGRGRVGRLESVPIPAPEIDRNWGSRMKLALLGGGGFRVPQIFGALASHALDVAIDQLWLHDADAERLAVMQRILAEMAGRYASPPQVHATTDLAQALAGADFVFSAIRVGGTRGRINDERVALGLGLLGQETVGPGGFAYGLRTLPVALQVAQTVREVAPDAWVINFTNPAGVVTEAMGRVLGERVLGICDTPIGLVKRVAALFGVDADAEPGRLEYDYAGLNHLGWLRALRVDGRDVLGELLVSDELLEQIEEARLMGLDWVRAEGALPNEYLYYYRFTDRAIAKIAAAGQTRGEFLAAQQGEFYNAARDAASPLELWRAASAEREATYMAESRDEARRPADLAGGGYQEVALRLMAAIAGGPSAQVAGQTPKLERNDWETGLSAAQRLQNASSAPNGGPQRMILNVRNAGTLPQLPADATIEVPCLVDAAGARPLPVAALSLPQLGLVAALKGAERDLIDAAISADRRLAWRAFAEHPLVGSPELGRQLLDAYLASDPLIAQVLG